MNVGERVNTYAEYHALPVGTVVAGVASPDADRWIKRVDQCWYSESDPGRRSGIDSGRSLVEGRTTIISIPPAVGDRVATEADFAACPIGTQMLKDTGYTYIKDADGWYEQETRSRANLGYPDSPGAITFLPGEERTFAINDRIFAAEAALLPIGAEIQGNRRWRKTAVNEWTQTRAPMRTQPDSYFGSNTTMRLVLLPVTVGSTVSTAEEFASLPVGIRLRGNRSGREWEKRADGNIYTISTGQMATHGTRLANPATVISLSTAAPAPASTNTSGLTVGDMIRTREQFEGLPVGTRIQPPSDRSQLYVREADVWCRINEDGTPHSAGTVRSRNAAGDGLLGVDVNVIISIPSPWVVGQVVTLEQQRLLPVGSVISRRGLHTKQTDGSWLSDNGGVQPAPGFTLQMTLVSVGTDTAVHQSVGQFMWELRRNLLHASRDRLNNAEYARRVLTNAGITDDVLPVGTGVTLFRDVERELLPDGTVVYTGDPENPTSFGVFQKQNGRFVHLLGRNTSYGGLLTVESVNGTIAEPEWNKPASEPQTDEIARVKGRVWAAGWEEKQSQGWCSEYEEIVRRFGLSERDLDALMVTSTGLHRGQVVTPEQAQGLPLGSVFRWISPEDPERWAYYMRAEHRSPNRAGTRSFVLHGGAGGHFSNSNMTLEWTPEFGPMRIPLPMPADLFEVLPPGTVFESGNTSYVICEDHRAIQGQTVRSPGQYNMGAFGPSAPFVATRFPGMP